MSERYRRSTLGA